MAALVGWAKRRPAAALAVGFVNVVVLFALLVGAAQATDRPGFCGSACHEMSPFHEAWSQGPHAEVSCVSCHVDPGIKARLGHKIIATKELWSHFTTTPSFPSEKPIEVPSERCVACHKNVKSDIPGFDHARHAGDRPCQHCHATAGHEVEADALKEAGVYSSKGAATAARSRIAAVGQGRANVVGHVKVACSDCHDLAKTGCASCHEPKHERTGPAKKRVDCSVCHAAGERFVFAHPASGDCATCHEKPAQHKPVGDCSTCHLKTGVDWTFTHSASSTKCEDCHDRPDRHRAGTCTTCHKPGDAWTFAHPGAAASCTQCHKRPASHSTRSCTTCHGVGTSWAFRHPGKGATCTSCHPRPSGHSTRACTTCHGVGTSWAFKHPGKSATCTSCHPRPSGHSTRTCTTCHGVGTSWAFKHPGSSSKCTNCHARPSGHSASTCTTCHGVGSSWAFKHPSGTSCGSCHKAPSNHYGSSCSSCHTPSKPFSQATFSHPSIPGGEHSYKSFSCTKCHPSGYSSYSCRACHDSNNPDDDDD